MEKATIHRNLRRSEDDFSADIVCEFCHNQYNSQLLKLPFVDRWICKGCLQDAVSILDKNMINNFQPDFERSRKGK
jgi:hypothetical protein